MASAEFGVIECGKVYSLAAFQEQTKCGPTALRKMRRDGLPIRRVGSRSYIVGDDAVDFFKRAAVVGPRG